MNHSARRSGIPFLLSLTFAALALAFCRATGAQVIEPNGTPVPATTTMDAQTLQAYFTSINENINAVAQASIVPSTFMPLCNFQATLTLSESSAPGGLGWYNVPDATTDPNHTQMPTVYPIGPFPMVVGTAVGSSDIRNDPNYAGGLVGFALMKNLGSGAVPVYYSEDTRNADCTGCTMPGYWKMMLSYLSTMTSNEYYMAWEDWEGANTTTWFGNDGDFNDKVFAITGVTCDGGGVPCMTNMPGVCATGITQCVVGETPTCTATIKPTAEKCDNLDNDCNGMVDDGTGLCPGNQVCSHGQCIDPCSTGEFACGPPLVCVNGFCVDPGCESMTCNVGQVCHGGVCVGGCDGVVCPTNQICELGVCVDPCAGVTCKAGACVLGACVQSCSCQACPSGQTCLATGACVDTGCDKITCNKDAGEVCVKGACKDACADAKCPGGATCTNGQCGMPLPPPPPTGAGGTTGSGGDSATSGAGGTIVATGGSTGRGGSGAGGTLGLGGTGTTGNGGTGAHESGVVSCNCTTAGAGGSGGALLLGLMALGAFTRRRARR